MASAGGAGIPLFLQNVSATDSEGKGLGIELGVPLFLIVVSAAFLFDARSLPGPMFDSLGPAPIPRLICGCVIALCITVMVQTILGRGRESKTGDMPTTKPQPMLALGMLGLTALYVLGLVFRIGSFALVTLVYLFICIAMLTNR